MIITYRPVLRDLLHAARAWEAQHWVVARHAVATLLVACGVFLAYAGSYWWSGVFLLVGVLEWFALLPASALRAVAEFRGNPKFREEYELTLTPDHLRFRTVTIDSTLKWTHYSRHLETDKAFMLVYGKRMYSVIPKRAVAAHDLDQLRALLASVLPTGRGRAS